MLDIIREGIFVMKSKKQKLFDGHMKQINSCGKKEITLPTKVRAVLANRMNKSFRCYKNKFRNEEKTLAGRVDHKVFPFSMMHIFFSLDVDTMDGSGHSLLISSAVSFYKHVTKSII
jgi:hypothetical protein